jgi:RNA polymerase sigma factor (sigma-70 family)
MPQGSMNRLLDHLRRVTAAPKQPPGDGELLACFIERREEDAFAALLRRHGPMVLGVCRRVLGDIHDAEDAFQATFLVLVRKAASVRPREAVGNWLYGVAYRTALEARGKIARRHAREKPMDDMPQPEAKPEAGWHELLPLLDQELHRLPDKYRLAVVLCDVEGRSRKEVARQLAIPEGTLSSRLATARKQLAARLARLGFVLSVASLAALLSQNAAPACVPASLLFTTTRAALLVAAGHTAAVGVVSTTVASLTEGVLKTMLLAKLKTASVVLFGAAALSLGTGGLLYQTRAGAADSPQPGQQQPAGPANANRSSSGVADVLAQRQREKAKLAAEDARAREQALLEELEKARREAEMQRRRAEEEHMRAEEALRALKERLAEAEVARRDKGKALYAQGVRQAQQQSGPKREEPPALERLAVEGAKARERFKEERQRLMERLKQLEVEERETLEKLEAGRRDLLKQANAPQPNRQPGPQAAPAGDKLDQILQRLERLERRLDRLEQGRPSSGGRR